MSEHKLLYLLTYLLNPKMGMRSVSEQKTCNSSETMQDRTNVTMTEYSGYAKNYENRLRVDKVIAMRK